MAAPNLQAIRDRLNKLNRPGGEKKNDVWKPKDSHEVRLLMYPGAEDPFLNVFFHFDIGDEPLYCPKSNKNEDCDVCDFCDQLKSFKDPQGNQKPKNVKDGDWELFKKIQPKCNIYVPMVERGHETEGAKFWRISQTLAGQLIDICAEGDRNEGREDGGGLAILFSNTDGYDLTVTVKKPGEDGNNKQYALTEAKAKIKTSALSKDKKVVKEIMDSIKKIEDVYPAKSSAEVSKIFKRFANAAAPEAKADGGKEYAPKKDAASADDEVVSPKKTFSANTKENAKLSGTKSIDEAFGELTGE